MNPLKQIYNRIIMFEKRLGRINRKTWWLVQLLAWGGSIATFFIYKRYGLHDAILSSILTLLLITIRWIASIQRLHDRNKTGLWIFVFEIPIIGTIWSFIELGGLKGKDEGNQFGEREV